ncbi:MAG: hypothetical protein L0H19_06020 [Salinisphaera sp.]|nr:hypothetical protein [Salinisphaera sp.]MDN5937923.1 hypothetical protein [Salinisphaera sp.]
MGVLAAVLALLSIGLCGLTAVLALRLLRLNRRLQRLEADWQDADEDVQAALAEQPRLLVTIDILNPLELARARSRIGARLIAFAPQLVTRRVFDSVARQLDEQLAAQGVEAQVQVHKAGS